MFPCVAPHVMQRAVLSAAVCAWSAHGFAVAGSTDNLVLLQRSADRLSASVQRPCSLLLFAPVGDVHRGAPLWKENIKHVRNTLKSPCTADVFLNHYDQEEDAWKKYTKKWGEGWYDENVQYSTTLKGYKFQVMQELMRDVDIHKYDWVWAVDEDVNMTQTDVQRLLDLADESGSLITLPAFTQFGETPEEQTLSYPMNAPTSGCSYRYAPVVEVIFPMFRPAALEQVLWKCDDCIGDKCVWGLDRLWCAFSARTLGHDRNTACAIIDGAPVIHQNFKTLQGKYDDAKTDSQSTADNFEKEFHDAAMAWMEHVQKTHSEDFVDGYAKDLTTTDCVKHS